MSKKRRSFAAQFKLETVLEGIRGESIAQLCRERDITETMYYKWRDVFLERAAGILPTSAAGWVTTRLSGWRSWSGW
jgi:transposase